MIKLIKIGILLTLMVIAFETGKLWQDNQQLQNSLIRLHVVANSDTPSDQAIKNDVKDAIVSYITPYMREMDSREDAMLFLGEHLEQIRLIGQRVLTEAGVADDLQVLLGEKNFNTREYDTFSLPAGRYQTLQVTIGNGEGKNWWCVAFPTLCLPTTAAEFADVAASAGLDGELTNTLIHENGYELRFYFLDQLGKLEKFLIRDEA